MAKVEKDSRKKTIVVLSVMVCLALCLRILALVYYIEEPGDAQTFAIEAYNWAESPFIVEREVQLPGFVYLAGLFSFLVHDPWVSSRILNLILGTITVPVYFLLVRRIFGTSPALFGAFWLAILPLHVGLSASSMTDTSFLLELLVGLLLLIKGLDAEKRRLLYLGLSLFAFTLALATRYEAWVIILPTIPLYFLWKTRNLKHAVLVGAILALFPVYELVKNYIIFGHILPVFSAAWATGPTHMPSMGGYKTVDIFRAGEILAGMSRRYLGWILFLGILVGALVQGYYALRRRITAERLFYMSVLCIFWSFMVFFTLGRAGSMWGRYLLFGWVLALPLAALPFIESFKMRHRWMGALVLVGFLSLGFSYFTYQLNIHLTRRQPTDILALTEWFQNSKYQNDAIIFTRIDSRAKYFPLLLPEAGPKHLMFSHWKSDAMTLEFWNERRPSILITCDKDRVHKERFERLVGGAIDSDLPVHTQGDIKVYDITGLFKRVPALISQ